VTEVARPDAGEEKERGKERIALIELAAKYDAAAHVSEGGVIET